MLFDLRHAAFRSFRDIGLFLTSTRSGTRLVALRQQASPSAAAFDRPYAHGPRNDPWAVLRRSAARVPST